jgi:hypothetical protein
MNVRAKNSTNFEPKVTWSSSTMLLPPPHQTSLRTPKRGIADSRCRVTSVQRSFDSDREENGFDSTAQHRRNVVSLERVALDDGDAISEFTWELRRVPDENRYLVSCREGLLQAFASQSAGRSENRDLHRLPTPCQKEDIRT